MLKTFVRISLTPLLVMCLSIFLISCSTFAGFTHDGDLKPAPWGQLNQDSNWLADQLSASNPEYNYDWQILLARAYSKEGDSNKALDVVAQMRKNAITPLQGNQADIVEAQIKAAQGNFKSAYALLNSVNIRSLPKDNASFYYMLKGNVASQLAKDIDAAKSYLQAAKYYSGDSQVEVYKRALNSLEKANSKQLYAALKASDNTIDRGFYEYAMIQKSTKQTTRDRLMTRFNKKYPNHPIASVLASNAPATDNTVAIPTESTTNTIDTDNTNNIAVFLPLSGRYAEFVGNPIKLGILNAYKDRGINVKIQFYDTNGRTMADVYAEAMQQQPKVIIGPIIKSEVNQLAALKPTVPVIALNEATVSTPSNFYFLTQALEIDAASAALEIQRDNLSTPIIIAPQNKNGERMVLSLNRYWNDLTSNSVSVCYFTSINSLEQVLTNCFNQGNFDAAYIYGTANEASVIREYIRKNSSKTQSSVPLFYIGSKSNNGVVNSSALSSLSGMKLGDQPWLLKDSAKKEQAIVTLPRANGDILRCFGIGYDALNIAIGLPKLQQNQREMIRGLSGDIYIDSRNTLQRKLSWQTIGADN